MVGYKIHPLLFHIHTRSSTTPLYVFIKIPDRIHIFTTFPITTIKFHIFFYYYFINHWWWWVTQIDLSFRYLTKCYYAFRFTNVTRFQCLCDSGIVFFCCCSSLGFRSNFGVSSLLGSEEKGNFLSFLFEWKEMRSN